MGWGCVCEPSRGQNNAHIREGHDVSYRNSLVCGYADFWSSLGTKKWDGLPLYSGYSAFIGGREVELDSQISESELPTIVGSSIEASVEPEFDSPSQTPARHSFLVKAKEGSVDAGSSPSVNSPAALKKFIPPTSFYGKAPAKPKPRGPLYASMPFASLSVR